MTGKPTADETAEPNAPQRLDKWLWYVRAVKSRTLAASLVTGGKVRINRQKVDKPSHMIKPGDVLTLTVRGKIRILEVVSAGTRRGPAAEAALLFKDLTEPAERSPSDTAQGDAAPGIGPQREPGSGRPTKRERRQIDQLQRNDR